MTPSRKCHLFPAPQTQLFQGLIREMGVTCFSPRPTSPNPKNLGGFSSHGLPPGCGRRLEVGVRACEPLLSQLGSQIPLQRCHCITFLGCSVFPVEASSLRLPSAECMICPLGVDVILKSHEEAHSFRRQLQKHTCMIRI